LYILCADDFSETASKILCTVQRVIIGCETTYQCCLLAVV